VISHLEHAYYLGAVAVGALIFDFLFWWFGFLRMGTTGLTAQSLGARDADEMRAWLARAGLLAVIIGCFLIAVQIPVLGASLEIIDPGPKVRPLTDAYFSIRIWGAPATISLYAITGWLIATERTRAVFALQLWMNGLNIALDLWFVLGLDGFLLRSWCVPSGN